MPRVSGSGRTIGAVVGLAFGLAVASPVVAQAVVQPIPGVESRALNAALARVAANPGDADALVDAGNAALQMNDVDAAVGFFTRAEQLAPGNGRAKTGLAGSYVRSEDPYTAIRLYEEAERYGPMAQSALVDRGLAYDLVGDNATAQRYYRQAGPGNDEALRRLALSLAIAGDRRGSENALAPLLARQDKGAWRARAFALAILGDDTQAVTIATATMPAALATGMAPYLRYMRQLTRAQQAAAANLGHFPRASEIGRDDPRIAEYSAPSRRPPATGVDAGLVPAGAPLGKGPAPDASLRGTARAERPSRQDRRAQERLARQEQQRRQTQRERPPEPVVVVSTSPPASSGEALMAPRAPLASPPAAAASSGEAGASAASISPPSSSGLASAAPGFSLAPAAPAATPPGSAASSGLAFSLAPAERSPAPPAAAASPPTPTKRPVPVRPRRLADAFDDLSPPTINATPTPGAVDIRRIAPIVKAEKPSVPAQSSRIWVQVATGRNKQALGFDWRRMVKDSAVFRGKKPYVAAWGQTNRLLTGPFETEAAANAFVTQLRRADVEGAFLWTSPAGQVVDALSVAK